MAALILGLLLIVLGVSNIRGNISSIHWYNRRKVSAEDVPAYGRGVGSGTVLIGASLISASVLEKLTGMSILQLILLPGTLIGLILILRAQFRYNHGIF